MLRKIEAKFNKIFVQKTTLNYGQFFLRIKKGGYPCPLQRLLLKISSCVILYL